MKRLVRILCKVHGSGSSAVLAVCDKELCGNTIKAKETEFVVSNGFYNGSEISEPNLREKLHAFENINIVGNKAVGIALEEKIVSEESVLKIGGIKHVQIFKI